MKFEITKPERHEKSWGHEDWLVNNEKFCGKILFIKKGAKFSGHYHLLKFESQHIFSGKVIFRYINLKTAKELQKYVESGETIHLPIGQVHQLEALEDTVIFEVSNQHFDEDSYRVWPGDSQK